MDCTIEILIFAAARMPKCQGSESEVKGDGGEDHRVRVKACSELGGDYRVRV